jgi:hypothetical protein
MGGSSKSTQTTFTSQPGVNEVLGSAKTIFNSGVPWAPDTSSHVTPFSQQTSYGLTGLTNVSKAAIDPFNKNFGRINAVVGDGGLNNLQDQQVGRLQGVANNPTGLNALQMKAYNQLTPTANGLNAEQQQALNYLTPIASGQARQNNPYLDGVIRRTSDDIGSSTNLQASAAGRYGSGAHQGVLADAVGDMSANMRYQDYGQQQGRQDAAINSLFGMGTTGATQRSNALGQQFGMGATGQQQRMDAIGSLYNAGREQRQNVLAGTQQLQDAYQARLDPFRTMLDVGQQYEGLNSRVLQDQARILQERKNALTDPVNWLANLAGAFQGGQQVQTTRTSESPFNNPLFNGLLGKVFGL